MPIAIQIHHDRRRVDAVATGAIGHRELIRYKKDAWNDPAVAGYDELFDLSQVDSLLDPNLSALKELAHLAASMDPAGEPSKFAIVVAQAAHFGLARLYQGLRKNAPRSNRQVSVFHSREEAEEWLGSRAG